MFTKKKRLCLQMISWFWLIFLESYKNNQQDAIQSAYFGNQCFSIGFSISFTACCYFNVDRKIRNSNVILVTERSDHKTAASMNCLEQVVAKIESKHGKCYEICTCGEMKRGFNSGLILFLNRWRVPFAKQMAYVVL